MHETVQLCCCAVRLSLAADAPCRLKRETERIKREIEQREMEEALALVKASGKGKGVKIKVRSCPLSASLGRFGLTAASAVPGLLPAPSPPVPTAANSAAALCSRCIWQGSIS